MGYGKDFLLGEGFGVIMNWTRYHERYHGFQVGPIHGLVNPSMYGLGFWFPKVPLSPLPKGSLLPPPGGLLPPLPKGPPPLLLIGTIHPPISGLPTSPIKDGLPF
jgi:hypothetical protein